MEISPAVMDIIVKSMEPMIELTRRFTEATAWVENDDSEEVHKVSLGMRWELMASSWASKNQSNIENYRDMERIVELARHYPIDVVEPYLRDGYTDIDLISKSIDDGIDMDLLLSLKAGYQPID